MQFLTRLVSNSERHGPHVSHVAHVVIAHVVVHPCWLAPDDPAYVACDGALCLHVVGVLVGVLTVPHLLPFLTSSALPAVVAARRFGLVLLYASCGFVQVLFFGNALQFIINFNL